MSLIKFVIRLISYLFVDFLLVPSFHSKSSGSLVVVRLDAIGDYVLFRNFLESIKCSEKYRYNHLTLIGNVAWKDLALSLDAKVVDRFIWVDRKKFNTNLFYRYSKLNEIKASSHEVCISPVFSRDFFNSDWVVKSIKAVLKIGSIGDYTNISGWQKTWSDRWYDNLIEASDKLIFEYERNIEFFKELFGGESFEFPPKPYINTKDMIASNKLLLPTSPFAVLFIGASANFRKWPVENFVKIGDFLHSVYGLDIVLCGGPNDVEAAFEFLNSTSARVRDLVGKTSLVDLLLLLKHAELMVSNETSGPHFAVALDVPDIFVISNGNHFGRFSPYPKCITESYHVIFHPEIDSRLNSFNQLCDEFGMGSKLDIKQISAERVITCIVRELENEA